MFVMLLNDGFDFEELGVFRQCDVNLKLVLQLLIYLFFEVFKAADLGRHTGQDKATPSAYSVKDSLALIHCI